MLQLERTSMLRLLSSSIRSWSVASQCWEVTRESRRHLRTVAGASSSTHLTGNPFPYPIHRNPTPHQLFHLPHNATKSDIKARYYDLVRLYHPDKVGVSVSSDIAHARFQAIMAAYDVLRGKTLARDSPLGTSHSATAGSYGTTAAYRAARRKRQELYETGAVDDSRKDKLILFGVVLTIIVVIAQTATTRREVLADAVRRQRQFSSNPRRNQQTQEEQRLSQDHARAPSEKT